MQYVKTKYLGATDFRGSRIKATLSYGKISLTMGYDCALNSTENHEMAFLALCEQVGWDFDSYTHGGGDDDMVWLSCDDVKTK